MRLKVFECYEANYLVHTCTCSREVKVSQAFNATIIRYNYQRQRLGVEEMNPNSYYLT